MKIFDKIFKRKSHAIDPETLRKMGIKVVEPRRIEIKRVEPRKVEPRKIEP